MKKFIDLRNPDFVVVLGFILLICILFSPVIFQGKMFGSPDSLSPKAASNILNKKAEETGEFLLWQPWIFSGMPTAEAFTNISKLYFPYYIFKLLFIPGLFIQLIHLIFCGVGGYLVGRKFNLSTISAFLVGAGFMITPFILRMIVFGHGSKMMTASYLPWIFLLTLKLFEKHRIIDMGFLAILLGFQLQRGHAQIVYYTLMFIGAYVLYQIIVAIIDTKELQSAFKGTALFLGAMVLASGMAMLVYLPSMEYAPYSVRGAGVSGGADYGYATNWSFHPKEMITFLIPSAFGFGGQTYWGHMPFTDFPNYMGVIILLLAIIGLVRRWEQVTWFFLVTSILALLISFGKHFSLVFDFFYNVFPFFSKFRVPTMILILLQFNVAILAGFGLDSLLTLRKNVIPRWIWILAGVLGFFTLVLVIGELFLKSIVSSGFTAPRTQDPRMIRAINALRWDLWYEDAWIMILFVTAFLAMIWLWIKRMVNRNLFLIGIVAVTIIDIGIVDQKIIQPSRKSGRASQLISSRVIQRYLQPDKVIKFLQEDKEGQFRIYAVGQLFNESRFKAFGIESVGGYHAAKLKVYNRFLEKTRKASTIPLMKMLNVKFLVSPQEIKHPDLAFVYQDKLLTGRGYMNVSIYKLKKNLPRAWFVQDVNHLGDQGELWRAISDPSFDPDSIAYVTEQIDISDDLGRGSVEAIKTTIHQLSIETSSDTLGFLVVSEVYFPLRWKASIDGKPAETIKANGVIRGVIVPAGEHKVEFNYDKSSFHNGIKVSLISFFISICFISYGIIKKRRGR